jgi:hypothetical protein
MAWNAVISPTEYCAAKNIHDVVSATLVHVCIHWPGFYKYRLLTAGFVSLLIYQFYALLKKAIPTCWMNSAILFLPLTIFRNRESLFLKGVQGIMYS